jgi:hemerythrin
MKTTAITELMVKDHLKLIKLVNSLEDSLGKSTLEIKITFDSFLWELEKHLFTEEKAIFTQYESEDVTEISRIIAGLFKEHDKILAKLKDMRNAIKRGRDFDFLSFKEMLLIHKNYEADNFYPKLDQELDEDTKEKIVSRINEIV